MNFWERQHLSVLDDEREKNRKEREVESKVRSGWEIRS